MALCHLLCPLRQLFRLFQQFPTLSVVPTVLYSTWQAAFLHQLSWLLCCLCVSSPGCSGNSQQFQKFLAVSVVPTVLDSARQATFLRQLSRPLHCLCISSPSYSDSFSCFGNSRFSASALPASALPLYKLSLPLCQCSPESPTFRFSLPLCCKISPIDFPPENFSPQKIDFLNVSMRVSKWTPSLHFILFLLSLQRSRLSL